MELSRLVGGMHLGALQGEPYHARAARAEGGAMGRVEHPDGINKGQQDGQKAKVHGNQCGHECRRGRNGVGMAGARLTAQDTVSAICNKKSPLPAEARWMRMGETPQMGERRQTKWPWMEWPPLREDVAKPRCRAPVRIPDL